MNTQEFKIIRRITAAVATISLLIQGTGCLFDRKSSSPSGASAPTAGSSGSTTSTTPSSGSTPNGKIQLSWDSGVFGQDGFLIEQSTDGQTFSQIKSVGVDVHSYIVTGLAASTTYYFRIRAFNAQGTSGNTSAVHATTAAQ